MLNGYFIFVEKENIITGPIEYFLVSLRWCSFVDFCLLIVDFVDCYHSREDLSRVL